VLDIRTYRLVPGGRNEFDRLFRERALPMLERHAIRVVAFGPSIADEDHYVLVRAFESAVERQDQLGVFYGSSEWRETLNDQVMALIESFHVVAIPSPADLASVRMRPANASSS
jgi:hypothetical protein